MKLLFDQNISYRIVKKVISIFPDSKQIRALNLENATDYDIWNYAKNNGFTIVTFDADFSDIATMKGNPPKIIWLRTGNTTTKNLVELFKKYHIMISEFIQNSEYSRIACLEITD